MNIYQYTRVGTSSLFF